MDEKNREQDNKTGSAEPKSHSAFVRRDKPAQAKPEPEEKPIPSQPRSFSPVRPQRNAVPRKSLTTPAPGAATGPASNKPAPKPGTAGATADKSPGAESTTSTVPPVKPASDTGKFSRQDKDKPALASSIDKTEHKFAPKTASSAAAGAAAAAATDTAPETETAPPQSSGAGGDTIRLRVTPRAHARTLNTAPGRGMRRRLPDIRQGKSSTSSAGHYGPFSLMFGFLWLIFKMVFFTVLTLGLGALIGFIVMTEYIKTPEKIVPNVSGMKIEEAFEVLSDKNLGVIKLGTESSGLVAPGEIISQQPPAGASAKENTDVGVVISSGRSQYVVPNVVNETKENALNKIRGARLEVGNVLTIEDNSVPAGNVISQTPIGDTGSDEVIKVDLMISAGPPGKSLTMPDLTGRSVLEAKAALKAVGISDVVSEPADAEPDATVSSHSPLVGKTVFQTDRVTLYTGQD